MLDIYWDNSFILLKGYYYTIIKKPEDRSAIKLSNFRYFIKYKKFPTDPKIWKENTAPKKYKTFWRPPLVSLNSYYIDGFKYIRKTTNNRTEYLNILIWMKKVISGVKSDLVIVVVDNSNFSLFINTFIRDMRKKFCYLQRFWGLRNYIKNYKKFPHLNMLVFLQKNEINRFKLPYILLPKSNLLNTETDNFIESLILALNIDHIKLFNGSNQIFHEKYNKYKDIDI